MENKKVDMKIFIWVIGVILIVFGFLFNTVYALNNKVDYTKSSLANIEIQLSQIQTDLRWIRGEIDINKE